MDYLSPESEYLISLLKSAVRGESVPAAPEDIDWKKLVDLSKKQQVYSVICHALNISALPLEQAQELQLYNQNELLRIIAMKSELEGIEKELENNQVKYMLLKGSVLRDYYPQSKMRQMSDIDILFDGKKRQSVADIMHKMGYEVTNNSDNSDDYFKAPFYTFEFHRKLFFEGADFCPDLGNVWEKAIADNNKKLLYHMDLNDMYIYNICHMYKHFVKSCCGIRFLIDNYLFLKKENDKLDWKYIENRFNEIGILDFERQTRALAFNIFDGNVLTSEDARQLYYYTNFGIYGDSRGTAVQDYSKLRENNSKTAAGIGFVFKRIFPERKIMERFYPYLKERPYLIGLAYIQRLFKGVFHFRKAVDELESINDLNK